MLDIKPGFYWFRYKGYTATKIGQIYYLDVEKRFPLVYMFGWSTCFSLKEVLKDYEIVEEVKPCSK
jgi:hypothetical protein